MTVALRESPSDTAQLLSRMKQLADGGEFERALSLCETHGAALRLVPDFHLLTALIHVEIGNLEEALEALGRTLFLDESCVLAQVLKAVCLRRLGRSAAARRWCRNAARHLESISDDALISGLDAVFAGDCKVLLSGLFEGKPGHV
jgi:tetratricopeptide (TPR) repeat protein